jgi:hypothetical protein
VHRSATTVGVRVRVRVKVRVKVKVRVEKQVLGCRLMKESVCGGDG